MPIYEYRCKSCGYEFSDKQTVDDRYKPKEEACPECNISGQVILRLGTPAVRFVGSGFYENDYKKKKK